MLSSYRVAVVVLYSYKDDYYKILLWKPRCSTDLGGIPLCFRLSKLSETVSTLGLKNLLKDRQIYTIFHLESVNPKDMWSVTTDQW